MEIEDKKIEKGKVRDLITNIENQKKIAEEKEKERRKMFLINKKEKNERIRKAAALQTGWKESMENVARWEEIEEIVIEESEENVNG